MTAMSDKLHFSGEISTVTPDGRSGVVTLDAMVGGKNFAVIAPETIGRSSLMSGHGGLRIGTRVTGEGVSEYDALLATAVRGMDLK